MARVKSRPSRARGLKLKLKVKYSLIIKVAPFAGAWIETVVGERLFYLGFVAPFAGALIETVFCAFSPLSRVRRALRGRVD